MTNQEAIQILDCERRYEENDKKAEALALGIKALEEEPCEKCISREDILNLPRKMLKDYFGEEVGEVVWVRDIESLPSVAPKQQRTGHWIPLGNYDDFGNESSYKCSECGDLDTYPDNFCHNCGARMTESEDT